MFPTGPIGELLVQGAPVIFPVAVSIDERGSAEGRDHVVVFGPAADVTAFVPGTHYGPGTTHALVTLARGELVSLVMRRWPGSELRELATAAPPGSVLVGILLRGRLAVCALPLFMLALCAAAAGPGGIEVSSMRERGRAQSD